MPGPARKSAQPDPGRPPLPEVDARVLARLRVLSVTPPQSLVIEGGCAPDRLAAAMCWARLLNCAAPGERPCGVCAVCRQILDGVFRDLLIVDKAFFEAAKAEDKTGTDKVRELLPIWGQPPHGEGQRVSLFPEAHELHPTVANLLLKTLEEPRPGNVFVLMAPQRERLLQTLVSRSFVLTLPWPEARAPEPDAAEWIAALAGFWETGLGWFERTITKGGLDRDLAQRVVLGLQRELAAAMTGGGGNLAARLARRGPAGLRRLDLALVQAQEALSQPTAPPALVLDWLATVVIEKTPGGTAARGRRY